MDTDDLSEEAYNIIKKAQIINEFLWATIGSISAELKNEDEYLKGINEYLSAIIDDPESFEEDWLLEDKININQVTDLQQAIDKVLAIPYKERNFISWD